MTEAPLFWLQQIENALQVVKEVPLWGSPPSFPWKECSEHIGGLLQLPDLKIDHKATQFLPADQLTSGLGANPIKTSIELSPLHGNALWLMPAEDVVKLTQLILNPQEETKGFTSSSFQEGFYRYLLLNIIEQINNLEAFHDLSVKLGSAPSLPQEGALCIDIAISHSRATLWGRLICPPSFHIAFKQHFTQKPTSILDSPTAKTLDLSLKMEVGHAMLNYAQWKTVEIGDLIVLDRCTYDPQSHKGTVTVVLENTPLFRARLKENRLKIVEYAYYHEEEHMIENDIPNDIPEDESNPPPHHEESYDELSEENEEHLWSSKEEHSDNTQQVLNAREVPLMLSVEVARLQMSLDKLLQLKPGNLIELPIRPEQGVDLMLSGKKVAKGELVKLGEVLGIKILQIGN